MPLLDLVTILCLGLMIGNELAVSLFVNPALWKLDPVPQAKALSLLARSLGRAMPFWYVLCLVLLIVEVYARRHDAHAYLLDAAIVIWVLVIIFTLALLVPINNRIARIDLDAPFAEWRSEHVRWDALHRWRILMLVVAMTCFVWSIVCGSQ